MSTFKIPTPEELKAGCGNVMSDLDTLRDIDAKHIVMDLETLGTSADAAILSIGAVALDSRYQPVSYFFAGPISLESNRKAEREVTSGTILWWMQQPAEARDFSFTPDDDCMHLYTALERFCRWADFAYRSKKVWGNGPEFDNVIFERAMYAYLADPTAMLWNYSDNQSLRTARLMDLQLQLSGAWTPPVIPHVALYDAYAEALYLQDVMDKLRELGGNKE